MQTLFSFRRFRDNWLKSQEDGATLISEYYKIAPAIVENINLRFDAAEIYKKIWTNYLKPCLSYIESGENKRCKELYVAMVQKLKQKYAATTQQ